MGSLLKIVTEQIKSLPLIWRLAVYEIKSQYQQHYFGVMWEFISPLIQILAYWFAFGIGIRRGNPVNGVPYLPWMLCGIIPWFFINTVLTKGSNSVFRRIGLVAKMNFPISALPTVTIVSELFSYFSMMLILVVYYFSVDITPTFNWISYFYYFFCMIIFMFAITLFNSTISTLVRDYQQMLQSVTRMLLFLTPILWEPRSDMSHLMKSILQLNPLYYIINGFRHALLPHQQPFPGNALMIYFWAVTIFFLVAGSYLHMKFRDRFVDFL